MANLTRRDESILESYLQMSGGHLLDFSHRTLAEFFEDFDIDITDEAYIEGLKSGSKANKMRGFWKHSNDEIVGKVLLGLIELYDNSRENLSPYSDQSGYSESARAKCIDIANKLILGSNSVHGQGVINNQDPVHQAISQKFSQQPINQQLVKNKIRLPLSRQAEKRAVQQPQKRFQQIGSEFMSNQSTPQLDTQQATKQKVFIVHGHNDTLRLNVENFIRKIELDPIILMDQASAGDTIIEKLENHGQADYAVVLYTACDSGKGKNDSDLKARARQNVVFEHGYFIARLGRKKVAAIVAPDVEKPNDTSGIVYIGANEGWKISLARELKKAGLTFNSEAVFS